MVKSGQGSGGSGNKEGRRMRSALQGNAGRRQAPIDPGIQHEIGKHLRAAYDDVINEPVPDKFLELLAQLERSTSRKS